MSNERVASLVRGVLCFAAILLPYFCQISLAAVVALDELALASMSSSPTCPQSCSTTRKVSAALTPSLSPVSILQPSVSFCRRTCFAQRKNFYIYQSSGKTGQCYCLDKCKAGMLSRGNVTIIAGYAPMCFDKDCPVKCQGPIKTPYITSPAASVISQQPKIGACRSFCTAANAPYYAFSSESTCSCYKSCTSTYAGVNTPSRLGWIPACPSTSNFKFCSAFVPNCGACPGLSSCTNNANGLHRCCCKPPYKPVIRGGRLVNCVRQFQ